jgi:hypothetical protein
VLEEEIHGVVAREGASDVAVANLFIKSLDKQRKYVNFIIIKV